MQKLYAYVDESGQDTEGRIFVVGVVVLEGERDRLMKTLEIIEEASGKKNIKWHRARYQSRVDYVEAIVCSKLFLSTIFFETFTNTKQYLEMTAYATAKAVLKRAAGEKYTVTVFVDGLRKGERPQFVQGLRDLRVRRRKVRGVQKDEHDVFIRLADAVCGLVRDAEGNNQWAQSALKRLKKDGVATDL